jgi:hypothetical protein
VGPERYQAPANGTDCVQHANIVCPGTKVTRIVSGPWYFRTDVSFVKRFSTGKRTSIEARMVLFNLFGTVNFVATSRMGIALTSWDVTAAPPVRF